jgi:nucleotide-binding universal stress UspA family protein
MDISRHGDRDRGGRVVVGVDGSLGSLGALRCAVAEARRRGAQVCAVWVIPEDHAWLGIVPLTEDDVDVMRERIGTAFEEALGGVPGDLETRSVVLVGPAGRELVAFACWEDDLLVVGAGDHGRLRRWWHWSVCGYCVRHAHCPVLTVPLPEFVRTMRRAHLPRRGVGLDLRGQR